jgi:hypothetical protein
MKYQIGDLVFLKKYDYKPRAGLFRKLSRPLPHSRRLLPLEIENTFGIITKVEKHSDNFEKDSTADDNGYMWFSQVNAKEYHFYENEFIGEII